MNLCMKKKQIIILGAGITGLSLAWFLKNRYQDSISITIIEKTDRVGGWLQTITQDGFLFELGPHSYRVQKDNSATLELIESLGIQDKVIFPDPAAHQRHLLFQQRLLPFPRNVFGCLTSPLMRGVGKALWRDLKAPISCNQDESIYAFMERRLGTELTERLIDPLVSGIYAGDMRKLSIKSCFPQLWKWEQQNGSLLKGSFSRKSEPSNFSNFIKQVNKHGLYSFQEGIKTLPSELEKHLKENLLLSSHATALQFHKESIDVVLSNGKLLKADYLFSTLPAGALADLVEPHHVRAAQNLKSIPYTSVAVVNLGYRAPLLRKKGFGFLIPQQEKESALGMIWDSAVFPSHNRQNAETRLTVMMGGSKHPEITALGSSEHYTIARQLVAKHLNIHQLPDTFHPYIAKEAIPQYQVGHQERVVSIKTDLGALSSRLFCLGSAFEGVSINDCIRQAQTVTAHFIPE